MLSWTTHNCLHLKRNAVSAVAVGSWLSDSIISLEGSQGQRSVRSPRAHGLCPLPHHKSSALPIPGLREMTESSFGNRVVQPYQGNSLHNGNLAQFLKVHPFPWEHSTQTVAFPSHPTAGLVLMGMSPSSNDPVISQILSNKQSREKGLS